MGKLLSRSSRRQCIDHARGRLGVSDRRACRLLGQHRATQRRLPHRRDDENRLVSDMIELARRYVNGGGIMPHARRPGGSVAAAQNCATYIPLSVIARSGRCTVWSCCYASGLDPPPPDSRNVNGLACLSALDTHAEQHHVHPVQLKHPLRRIHTQDRSVSLHLGSSGLPAKRLLFPLGTLVPSARECPAQPSRRPTSGVKGVHSILLR